MSPGAKSSRDFDELERRRMRAAKLLHRGVRPAEVARQVKVSRESVRRWSDQIAKDGAAEGLKKAGRAGRRPRLSSVQLEKLELLLREGPEKAGFHNGLWTLERIAQVIRERFQVSYRAGHVWWILRQKLGWSCQRPVGRARERNEAAIRQWKENTWPALKKKPSKRAASSSS
jgi:transposase